MPQPRKHATNADRQKAYRDRKARREAMGGQRYDSGEDVTVQTSSDALTARVLAQDARMARET